MPRKPKHLTPEQLLNKIRKSAKDAARVGQTCYDKETLKAKKGYTDKQADIYISVFNENAGTPQEQAIRKARKAAQTAAAHGTVCPTKEVLLERGYTEQASNAYLSAYEAAKGTDEKQAIRKARKVAQVAAGQGTPCLTKEALLKKGYTEQASDAYLSAYQASKGTDEVQSKRKACKAAQKAATRGTSCPAKEVLIERGYTEQASEAYFATYKKTEKAKQTRLTSEQELQLQSLLDESSETNDYSSITSLFDSLGYQEDSSLSLTEQDEQYLVEVLGEESTNSNRLIFNFNSAETTSLTTSGFLSSLDEYEVKDTEVVYSAQVLR
ncbi:hypothetical protein [Candidatus Berkiella aquae]|uniref:Uncharacterized protein n=1 Tax=Candidatus Berkiella aquae TaxID=295108 RepID=A0A0Q9YXS0_9GAMM|nr:hypothetical protein [Candidatus Berkiella aquae]MCS5711389.1 hypothetical protein [Candidatus Berkiella aquae]